MRGGSEWENSRARPCPWLVMVMHMDQGPALPRCTPDTCPHSFTQSPLQHSAKGIIIFILQSTVKLREGKQLVPDHTASIIEPGSTLWS